MLFGATSIRVCPNLSLNPNVFLLGLIYDVKFPDIYCEFHWLAKSMYTLLVYNHK